MTGVSHGTNDEIVSVTTPFDKDKHRAIDGGFGFVEEDTLQLDSERGSNRTQLAERIAFRPSRGET